MRVVRRFHALLVLCILANAEIQIPILLHLRGSLNVQRTKFWQCQFASLGLRGSAESKNGRAGDGGMILHQLWCHTVGRQMMNFGETLIEEL